MSRLSVELVPRTCFWTNVRSNVSRADWEKCKDFVKARSGSQCEICGGRGKKHAVECHEIWAYDDERGVQKLIDLIALCPLCHQVKHIGRTIGVGQGDRAIAHLCRVNGWDAEHAERYIMTQFEIWKLRSQMDWELDISFLEKLGIEARVSDRG